MILQSELVTNVNYSCQTEIQIFSSKDSRIFLNALQKLKILFIRKI